MGLTAFLIVGMTGIPYNEIMLAAAFPALVYYGYLLVAVNLQSRMNNPASDALPVPSTPPASARAELRTAVRRYGHLLIALAVLIWLLVIQMPPAFAAVYSMVVIASTEIATQLWRSGRKPWKGVAAATHILVKGMAEGARAGAELAVVIAAIGIFVDVLVTTGFAQKLSYLLLDFASGDLWLMLVVTALACLIFGLGMPTPAAYILVALLGVPALERVGVPQLSAHMFVFYYANMSAISPPVAVAALVAAKLAAANYFKTAFAACRLGLAGFLLPFLFIHAPAILLLRGSIVEQWLTFFGALLALIAINMALVGHAIGPLSKTQRIAMVVAAIAVLQFTSKISLSGATVIVAILALQRFGKAKAKWRSSTEIRPRR
jgi:TRAP transporter 4TM/12TM fusion protein